MIPLIQKATFVLATLVCCLLATGLTAVAQPDSLFTSATFITGLDTLHYRLLYPKNYDLHRRYPLVVFVHGDSERGSDNKKQLYAIPQALIDPVGRDKYPCFILAPQCPKKRLWVYFLHFPQSLQATDEPTLPAQWTFALLDQLTTKLGIDQRRIYITGYSGGGKGTVDFLTRRPHFFAAAVPLCSVSDTAKARLIHHVPIWAFHGEKDEINPVTYSRMMIGQLTKYGDRPTYTEYPGLGHNIVVKAYQDPGLYEWLFAQQKKP